MKKYPTKEEIMSTPMVFDKGTVDVLTNWKTHEWKEARQALKNPKDKFEALEILLLRLAAHQGIKLRVDWQPEARDCFASPLKNRITLDGRLSIITALHEYAHVLNQSDDELFACRWSIWLFMQAFPITFKSLVWKGHMLTRPESSKCTDDK